jgi:nitrogen regulatory protein P-II 1
VKLIHAIIQPTKLEPLRLALERIGVARMTICDGQGMGRQRGQTAMYRGHEYKAELLRKVMLEIAVNDDFLERTLECITDVARTGPEGSIGDGKIFVLPMEDAIQIGGTVRGPEAI